MATSFSDPGKQIFKAIAVIDTNRGAQKSFVG